MWKTVKKIVLGALALGFISCSDPLGTLVAGDPSQGPLSIPKASTEEILQTMAQDEALTPFEKKIMDEALAAYKTGGAENTLDYLSTALKSEVPEYFAAETLEEDGTTTPIVIPENISYMEKVKPELQKIIRFEKKTVYYKGWSSPFFKNPDNETPNTISAFGKDYYLVDPQGRPYDPSQIGTDVFLYGHQLPAEDPKSQASLYYTEAFTSNGYDAYYSGIIPKESVNTVYEVQAAYENKGMYPSTISWTEYHSQNTKNFTYNCVNPGYLGSYLPIQTKSLSLSGKKFLSKKLPVFVVTAKTKDISTLEGIKDAYKDKVPKRILVYVHGTKMFANSSDWLDNLPVLVADIVRNIEIFGIKPFNAMKDNKEKNALMLTVGKKNFRTVVNQINAEKKFQNIDQVVQFYWNGGNDNKYREHAAIKLKETLYALASESMYDLNPVEFILVGHSHGNSVIGKTLNSFDLKDLDAMGAGFDRHISLNGINRNEKTRMLNGFTFNANPAAYQNYVQKKIRQVNFYMTNEMTGDGVVPRAWNDWIIMDSPDAGNPARPEFLLNIFQLCFRMFAEAASYEQLYYFQPDNPALAHDLNILEVCKTNRGYVNQDDNVIAAFQRIDQWRTNHEVSFMNEGNLKKILTEALDTGKYPSSTVISLQQ